MIEKLICNTTVSIVTGSYGEQIVHNEKIKYPNTREIVYKINEILDYLHLKHEPEEPPAVTIKCPDCEGGIVHGNTTEACLSCYGTGIQKYGLTKEQAKLALDKGWIVELEGGSKPCLSGSIGAIGPSYTYSIKCRAVETKENLKTWEALKLMDEGWEVNDGEYSYKIENGKRRYFNVDIPMWREDAAGIDTCKTWSATKRNYQLPTEDKKCR